MPDGTVVWNDGRPWEVFCPPWWRLDRWLAALLYLFEGRARGKIPMTYVSFSKKGVARVVTRYLDAYPLLPERR